MKKSVCILLCLLFIFAAGGCTDRKTASANGTLNQLPPPGSRRLVVLGDSIPAGYGLENPADNYVCLFAERIGATLQNHAVSGNDSADLLALLPQAKADIKTADILLISIGGNDLLHEQALMLQTVKDAALNGGICFPKEVEAIYTRFESNLSACLAQIQAENPRAVLLVQTIYNPVLRQSLQISLLQIDRLVQRYIDRLNTAIHSACNGLHNVFVLDIASRMQKDSDNFYDFEKKIDIHPTAHGHAALAEIITADFNALLA